MEKMSIKNFFSGDSNASEKFDNPNLTHFIGEHVHPSLVVSFILKSY